MEKHTATPGAGNRDPTSSEGAEVAGARRRFLYRAALLFGVFPAGARAQRGAMPRIGYLASGGAGTPFHEAFVDGLRELGWEDGRNVAIGYRFADGRFDLLPGFAAEFVRSRVDVIVAQPTPAAVAARNATASIPIVMINVGEPVRLGLVASLARPGGNVTGTAFDVGLETFGKALELLKSAIPSVRRVAVLVNPENPSQAFAVKEVSATARSLGLQMFVVDIRAPEDLPGAFARIVREAADAVFVVAEGLFILHRAAIARLALERRLPTMCGVSQNVEAGALMSYGPSLIQNSRRAARFVDRILKGAKPADLPVEQPTTFEFVVNQGTAKALGLAIPPSVLQRADRVIP